MSDSTVQATEEPASSHDDYAMSRVPDEAKYSWWVMLVQRLGQLSALTQFLIGASLGMGMTFWRAVIAVTIGSVLLELVTLFTGFIGQREGLSTSLLTRWTGFGSGGSALVGLVIAITSVGWFGVQNTFFAQSLVSTVGLLPLWVWSLVGGAIVTIVVVYGFASMSWIAFVTVPAFLLMAAYTVLQALLDHSLSDLIASAPAGTPISLGQGATLVAGGFIIGAIFTPDMTRFNRSRSDVVKQTVVGVTVGEYVICLTGVLLAHAARTSDIVAIIVGASGLVGGIIMVSAVLKVNDWNLYASSLATVNAVDVLLRGKRLSRTAVTIVLGSAGAILSAVGIIDKFVEFLTIVGVVIPPVAGIMIADYYVVRTWRRELDESRVRGELPRAAHEWIPATMLIWAGAALVGHYVNAGIPALNSIALAFVLYAAAGKAGLTRGWSRPATSAVSPGVSDVVEEVGR